jgi:hypothetical protein
MERFLALLCVTLLGAVWMPLRAQEFSSEELARRTIERRAVEAVIWGMPAVNDDLMLQEMLTKTDAQVNQIVYWGRPLDWMNQTLTPNPDTIVSVRGQVGSLRPVPASGCTMACRDRPSDAGSDSVDRRRGV